MKVIKGGASKGVRIVGPALGKAACNGIGGCHHQGVLGVDGVASRTTSVVPVIACKLGLPNTVSSVCEILKGPRIVNVDTDVLSCDS